MLKLGLISFPITYQQNSFLARFWIWIWYKSKYDIFWDQHWALTFAEAVWVTFAPFCLRYMMINDVCLNTCLITSQILVLGSSSRVSDAWLSTVTSILFEWKETAFWIHHKKIYSHSSNLSILLSKSSSLVRRARAHLTFRILTAAKAFLCVALLAYVRLCQSARRCEVHEYTNPFPSRLRERIVKTDRVECY